MMSCSFDSPESQARLPRLVAAAPQSFLSAATPHGLASPEEAIRVAFRALEAGASSVYCSASPFIIEAMARERIPVVGHLGMVPRHVTWTGYRAIGRTVEEAREVLGLPPAAGADEIRAACARLAETFAPEKGGTPYFAGKISEAADVLLGMSPAPRVAPALADGGTNELGGPARV